MTSAKPVSHSNWSARLWLVCFSAIAVSLPIAWISMAKVLIILFGLWYLVADYLSERVNSAVLTTRSVQIVLAVISAFAVSLIWTPVDMTFALTALVKHSKLIVIVLLLLLIRTEYEARIGITAFASGQLFLLASSWLLVVGVPVPWVTDPTGRYVVFSTYIDQSVMFATSAGIVWHLRSENIWPRWLTYLFAAGAISSSALLLEGRTGHLVSMAVLTALLVWLTPQRLRIASLLLIPILVGIVMYFSSAMFQKKIDIAISESQNYSIQAETATSSGWRINAWQRSIQAIQESPLHGNGVGSWATTVKRLQGASGVSVFGQGNASNPHQESLLWGVALGVGGVVIFFGLLVVLCFDSQKYSVGVRRAIQSTVVALGVASLFNSVLYDDLIGDYFCVALGLLIALGLQTQKAVQEQSSYMPHGSHARENAKD